MGILASGLGRGLAGLGAGMSDIANKYIDQNLALARAQAIADIQRTSNVQQAGEMQDLAVDPTRREATRQQAALDTASQSEAAQAAALSTATNKPLNEAQVAVESARERAKALNTAHDVAPGGKVIIGEGSNDKPTMVDAYREGWRHSSREDRDRMAELEVKSISDQLHQLTTTMSKGIADGSLSPEKSADGKNDGPYKSFQYLLTQQRALQLQRQAAIQASRDPDGAASPDPLGIRGSQKAPVSLADVAKDAQASGTTDYDTNIGGVKTSVRGGKEVTPAAPTTTAAAPAGGTGLGSVIQKMMDEHDAEAKKRRPAWLGGGGDTTPTPAGATPADQTPKTPSFMDRALAHMEQLGKDYSTPEGKAYLEQRVKEAKAGGAPLTQVEELRAKQAGLVT